MTRSVTRRRLLRPVALVLAMAGLGLLVCRQSTAAEVPVNMRSLIERTQSFGLGKFPISFWSYTHLREHSQYMTEEEVEEWADAGFTVPQSPSFDPVDPEHKAHMLRLLDWAQARGMKLIICDPRCHYRPLKLGTDGRAPEEYTQGVRAAVADFGNHPATFGFHVGDEPGSEDKDAFFACYRAQKEAAPDLHPFANLLPYFPGIEARAGAENWPAYLDEYVGESKADLISYDCYAQMNPGQGGWNNYYENLRLYREAALRNGVPFWNTVLSVGHFRYRCPNLDEIRWQFNTTIASGAHGLLWFFYYMRQPHANYRMSPVDELWDRTQTYYDIRRVQQNFHRHYGDLFTRIVATRVTFFPEPFGGGDKFTPNGLLSKVAPDHADHPILIGEFVDLQGRRYVMIVNNSMADSVHVDVTFPGADARVFSWNWRGQEYEGAAYSGSGRQQRDEAGLTIGHWLA
ncbi:MAG: hypothetical protein AB7W28_02925, partial [Armatimonadota bacterium]